MLIIGERINSTRKRIREAVLAGDSELIKEEARKQIQAGANMLDVNGGIAGQEAKCLSWLVTIVQEVTDVPLCLDSADPEALRQALPLCRKQPMINSITDETERFQAILPLIRQYKAKVIALCMSESAPPTGLEDRIETASRLVNRLVLEGISPDDIHVDPCVFPIGTGTEHGPAVLESITRIRSLYPKVHTSCGVSNVSFGLPIRKLLNQTFLLMLMARGMDTAIIDPCEEGIMARIAAAEALRGQDEYCEGYLRAYRDGKLELQRVATAVQGAV